MLKAPMFRYPVSPTPLELRKWGAYALLLLVPGSFLFLPAYWLARRLAIASRVGKHNGAQLWRVVCLRSESLRDKREILTKRHERRHAARVELNGGFR